MVELLLLRGVAIVFLNWMLLMVLMLSLGLSNKRRGEAGDDKGGEPGGDELGSVGLQVKVVRSHCPLTEQSQATTTGWSP